MNSIVFTVCVIFSTLVFANGVILQELSTKRQGFSVSSEKGFSPATASLSSLAESANLGPRSSFRYANSNVHKTAKGIQRVRLIQTYAGYDVFGPCAEAEMDNNNRFSGQMYGEVVRNLRRQIPNPDACKRKSDSLLKKALKLKDIAPNDPNIDKKDVRRIIFAGPMTPRARLAYKVSFFYMDDQQMTYPVYYFDACTGFVLMTFDQMKNVSRPVVVDKVNTNRRNKSTLANLSVSESVATGTNNCPVSAVGVGGNEKIGQITYNSQPFCLNVQRTVANCRMEGTYSRVIDNEGSRTTNKQTVADFTCSSGYDDPVNGAYGVANDALYYGEISGRLFEEKYDFRALPYKPRLVVHYGVNYENALWDGTDMYFGDGASTFYPFTTIDIVSHELAHGVTTSNSNLNYFGQSGGINEAFSDITGEATKYFGRNENDWLVGYDAFKNPNQALRYFRDPTDDGRSIKHVLGFRPGMDVHFSSGVFNHAFYRMVHTEEMDIFDAYKCFLDANLNLWGPFTNFFSGACRVMQAAYDNGFSHRKVRRSFWRVGIPLIFCNYAALTTSMYVGETRQNILVRAARSPIIELELNRNARNSTTVEVMVDDNTDIQIEVGRDNEVNSVMARGINVVRLDNSRSRVYIKLSSDATSDVKVTMLTSA